MARRRAGHRWLAGGKTGAVRRCVAGLDAAGATALVASMAPGRDGSGKSGVDVPARALGGTLARQRTAPSSTVWLMGSNCASRSGCWDPSRVLGCRDRSCHHGQVIGEQGESEAALLPAPSVLFRKEPFCEAKGGAGMSRSARRAYGERRYYNGSRPKQGLVHGPRHALRFGPTAGGIDAAGNRRHPSKYGAPHP
jgi:hypothetical protein